jgi:hypothetical protein
LGLAGLAPYALSATPDRGLEEVQPMPGTHVMSCTAVLLAMAISPGGSEAQTDWVREAERIQAMEQDLTRRADQLGADTWLGIMYNTWHLREHTCSILGRMLARPEVVAHLEQPLPGPDADGEELRLAAHSLRNWLRSMEILLAMQPARRIREWNLDCVGALGIPVSAWVPDQIEDAFYEISGDSTTLYVIGPVTHGYHDRLRAALDAHPNVATVALGSEGGLVDEAVRAGREIRRRGLSTTLWNNCSSACPLVFMGGVSRSIWSPYPQLGFHQIFDERGAVPLSRPIYARVRVYASAMGVDDRALIRLMASASPEDMATAEPAELCESRITTMIQRWCSAP